MGLSGAYCDQCMAHRAGRSGLRVLVPFQRIKVPLVAGLGVASILIPLYIVSVLAAYGTTSIALASSTLTITSEGFKKFQFTIYHLEY